jgi:eukaryotic-like serine/threonine-protein kinase
VAPEPSWSWPPGHELAPGLLAWALLGDGRRCETWLAWDLGRWCPVVVKLPRPGGQRGRAVAGLAQEAKVAAATAHPGIRRLLESRLDQPLPHLIFEYVEGPTLDDALVEDGPFHPVDVLLVGMQLAAALGHLHGRGLVHLDVKPGNVVLREGRPVLIDLGLARPAGEAPVGGHRRGSPPWMAPEQVHRRPAAPGMDLFALGAVLYELATGTQAFHPADDGPAERRWPQLLGPPPPPQPGGAGRRRPGRGRPPGPRPGRPPGRRLPGARPARRGHAGRRTRGGPALARLGHGTLASLHHGASPARSTACVGIAGGAETILVRMVATGKTLARPGTWSWGSPRGSRGGRGRVRALTRCRAPTGAPSFQTPC